jgi:glycosyltransferase involved in cell wall biosynthesis
VDIDYFAKPDSIDSSNEVIEPTVVFTGYMSNPNNERAAVFLVREVAPLIWRELPKARIQIVGADPSEALCTLSSERVEVTGRVDEIRPFLWNASVVLLSMQSGTGIKNKLLEAWAASAPVVATPLACQGVPAKDGENLLLADSGEALSRATIKLVHDPVRRQRIVEAGRKTVMAELTWTSAAQRMRQAVLGEQSVCL